MARTEEVLAFPCCFFYSMVALFNLEELHHLAPRDTTILIQDLDQVLRVCQACLERCHFRQYNIHGCLQALLQLRYMEDVMNS
jgi:hypothetical protein